MTDLTAIIAKCGLFQGLEEDELALLAGRATLLPFRKGDDFWQPGTKPHYFHIVVRGVMKLAHSLNTGRSAVLSIFGPTESIGDVAAIYDMPYPAHCVAVTDGEMLRIPRAVVLDLASKNASLKRRFDLAPKAHLDRLQCAVATLHGGSVESRLAAVLLDLLERLGKQREDGAWFVPIPITRRELSDQINARIETTIRTMSKWQKTSFVETRVNGYVIRDRDALSAIAVRGIPPTSRGTR